MNKSTLHKVLLARRLLELANDHLKSTNELSLSIAVNLLQDSTEAFLIAVSEHVNAGVKERTNFSDYFDKINEKIEPREIPFRTRLMALNRLRVNSKHAGLVPARSEVEGLPEVVQEVFEEVSEHVLDSQFAAINLIDLVENRESQDLLREAEGAFLAEEYEVCLVACRKALYLRYESRYSIEAFDTEDEPKNSMAWFGCAAPHYAQNRDYIQRNVKDPTDYIVLDHTRVDMELLKNGIDSLRFWNVWRYTPPVFRSTSSKEWYVKREFDKFEDEGIRERAEYVLDSTINLLVTDAKRFASTKWVKPGTRIYVELKKEESEVYEKASSSSAVVAVTPKGVEQLFVDSEIRGLDGEDYYHVTHIDEELHCIGYLPKSSAT